MNETLMTLRAKNPGLRLFSVLDAEFRRYGRVLNADTTALASALTATPIPEAGNQYVASLPALEAVDLMPDLQRVVFGQMPIQAGYCNGNGYKLNALEYHKCSEINFTTTGLVLLLALPEQLDPMVLHFAPCRIAESGFRCLVVLEQGTNAALPSVDTAAPGEEKLLWMRNKWMTCHPDSPQKEKGAFVGIRGENLALKI